MRVSPTEKEIEEAADLLVNHYNISSTLLGKLFGRDARDHSNKVLNKLGMQRLNRYEIAKMLIIKEGMSLFSGSNSEVKELRRFLLKCLPEEKIVELFNRHNNNNNSITQPSYMINPLVEKRWHLYGRWPRDFVKALGFPPIFAGVKNKSEKNSSIVDVEPKKYLPELVEFQKKIKDEMLEVLEREGDKTRCMIALPTGGGKTRIAVEAFIEWMIPRFAEGKYLIWIAQSEELCEQAISCIEDLWSEREFTDNLRIYRYFGGYEIKEEDLKGGVVVCSIQMLHNRIKSNNEVLSDFIENAGAMIIDEAHRAVSMMYDGLFEKAKKICGPDLFPICGLTATPGRSNMQKDEEISKLVNRFECYLIKPNLGREYDDNPIRYFKEHGYLARAHHITYNSGREYVLTDEEASNKRGVDEEIIPSVFLKNLSKDDKRNTMILKRLLKLPEGTSTIVYACTVEHAKFISVILNKSGRSANYISHETPITIRRGLIKDFKEGRLEFLCNFGVLTTGFDAPQTKCIAICRPTTSHILYEQIIGRGLRGRKFGGTDECTIIDFADNIKKLGSPLSYARFSDFWDSDTEEEN